MIIKRDQEEFRDFLTDAANFKGTAESVYFPETDEELCELLRKCSASNIKITIAGNGTGVTGARVPNGGAVISTALFNKIIEINKEERFALVQGGVILKDLQDAAEEAGLFYPPDPTEWNCFIGGTIATNASGARTFKYGPTRNYVEELRIILSSGEILKLKRGELKGQDFKITLTAESGKKINLDIPRYKMPPTKNAAGYFSGENADAIDLFIGSEGTLGIITEAKLRLLPIPQNIFSCIQFFYSETDALNFISRARELSRNGGLDARGLEYFDNYSLEFMRGEYGAIPENAQAAVWFEQEYDSENQEILIERWMELIANCGGNVDDAWLAMNKKDFENFKEFRHSISARVNEYCSSRGVMKVGTDTAVPEESFVEFYFKCRKVTEEAGLKFVAYGHAGNCHIHLNMLPSGEEEYKKARIVYGDICRLAVSFGGTVSAEHGIGKLKTGYLLDMYGEENVMQMAKMKKQIDPACILGIGNIFDSSFLKD